METTDQPLVPAAQAPTLRPATVWAWERITTHSVLRGGVAMPINLDAREAVTLLAFAEHADRMLCTGDGYDESGPLDIDVMLPLADFSANQIRRQAGKLAVYGLLVATGGAWRIPEEAFGS